MFERLRTALVSEPWRTTAMVLGLALVVSLTFNVVVSTGSEDGTAAISTTTSTTSTSLGDDQTTIGQTDTSSTTAPTTTRPPTTDSGAVVGIKVDNAPGARPQVGIGEAELLIEYPVEGGITRFTAVFPRETTGVVGPIRSLRPMDADLLPAVSPIVVSTGGQPFVTREVEAAGMNSIVAGFSSMFVSLGRSDPHDTFVDMDLLGSILDDSLQPAGGGLPSGGPLPSVRSAAVEVNSPLGSVFSYDPSTGYVRSEDGETFQVMDLDDRNPSGLSHETLVFLFAAERSAGYADSAGAPVSTFDVIGSGDLLVFHAGEAIVGSWSRSAQQDPFVFVDDIGDLFGLPGGHTYLAIVPRDSEVSYR